MSMYFAHSTFWRTLSRSNWNFGMLVFEEKEKQEYPEKKPLGARTRTNNKPNPHMTPSPGIDFNPGHIGGGMVQWKEHLPPSPLHDM